MLRAISQAALLGIVLVSSAAAAETAKPASDDKLIESSKPAAPSAPAAAPAAAPAEGAATAPVPPPPPPAVDPEPEPEVDAPKAQKKRSIGGAGLSTQTATVGGAVDMGESTAEKDWGFKFKGFFRAPMRLGIDGSNSLGRGGKLQFHAPPIVPDGNYTRWMYTNLSPGPWAELLFQYGNQRVMMTTSIASYNITSGGWRELQDQLGIDRAFLTLKFPEALGDLGGMMWDVGIFSNRYGAMGKYDAGQYETYMIGRTRLAGATATADMEIADDVKLIFEGGAGAKVDQQYQRYNCVGTAASEATCSSTYDYPSWQPYPGEQVQHGTNILVHVHGGAVLWNVLTAQLHYMNSFVRDARWNVGSSGGANVGGTAVQVEQIKAGEVPGRGSIQVFGGDLKLDGGWMGDGYLGVSYVKANNPLVVNDSIELLHSQGGWQLKKNYFDNSAKGGNILSIGFQYTFSLAAFMMRPRPFWGQATDITVRPFVMYNKVSGTNNGINDVTKLKGGVDVVYSFHPMLAAAFRFDAVQPDMDNSRQSFYIFSPRLIFRSEFVTHEAVVLQYSYYKYGADYMDPSKVSGIMPWPYGTYGTWNIGDAAHGGMEMNPDKHVITLYANMWW